MLAIPKGSLTDDERREIQEHVVHTFQFLKQIPLGSRMMAIADIYDALTASDRAYKKALQPEQALDVLERERRAGGLDGALLDLFIEARVFERSRREGDAPAWPSPSPPRER